MKKLWLWVCIGIVILVSGGIVTALLEPTQTICGYFAGDAFYLGRPTRYWREHLRAYSAISEKNIGQFRDTHASFAVLSECASDPDRNVRWPAINLLGRGEARSEEILSALVNALADEDMEVRLQAINALGRPDGLGRPSYNPDATAALKAL